MVNSMSIHSPFTIIVFMQRLLFLFIIASSILSCQDQVVDRIDSPTIVVLGNVQDAGSPHIACLKNCCLNLSVTEKEERKVVSLALINPADNSTYIFEATPDLSDQLRILNRTYETKELPDGIFLTHAHIGHYSGLMYLGKEATDAKEVDVYALPRMSSFLTTNGPWDQLVKRQNIILQAMNVNEVVALSDELFVTPLSVPHRDEYSETAGYLIEGPRKKVLFIPDIDKWSKWEKSIVDMIQEVDIAFLDATFYDGAEINNRDISEIPHPFVIESMELFDGLTKADRRKVVFIHFNHTNPLLNPQSDESKLVESKGYSIARLNDRYEL